MNARTFYSCIITLGVVGIIMVAANVNNQGYTGTCWTMGGVVLFVFVIVVLLMVLGLRTKISNDRKYAKKMPLADLAIDNKTKLITTRYIEDGRVVSKTFSQSTVRIAIDEKSKNNRVAILEIDGLEVCYNYKFWFIVWPKKTVVIEAYTLLISRPLDEVMDFYATCARR